MSSPDIQEITVPDTVEELLGREEVSPDVPWVVLVWNDPVNTFAYVIFVLQKLFGFSRAKASRLTNQVHYEGKAVVTTGAREKCEADVARLHAFGLWATMQKDD